MKKSKLLSLLLAAALVVSGLPASTVHATEDIEQVTEEQSIVQEVAEEQSDVKEVTEEQSVVQEVTEEQSIVQNAGSFDLATAESMDLDGEYDIEIPEERTYLYSFIPENDGYYQFESIGDADTFAVLYDSDLYKLDSNDDGGNGGNFKIVRYLYEGETYYLEVSGYDYCHVQTTVIVTIGEDPEESEDPSGTFDPSTAESMDLGGEYDIEIPDGETKAYSFTPEFDDYYRFESLGDDDTYATLYDSDLYELDYNDDGGNGGNFKIVRYLYEGETYYLEVSGYNRNYAQTTVTVNIGEAEPDEPDDNFNALVRYNEDAVLSVDTSNWPYEPSQMSFQWFDSEGNPIDNATASTFTVSKELIPVNEECRFSCEIVFDDESTITKFYTIKRSGTLEVLFDSWPTFYEDEVVNDTIDLSVAAVTSTSNEISYEWYGLNTYNVAGTFLGTGVPYKLNLNTQYPNYTEYRCDVSDGVSNMSVYVSPHLQASIDMPSSYFTLYGQPGEKLTLGYDLPEGEDLTYEWTKWDNEYWEDIPVEDGTERTIEIEVSNMVNDWERYECRVSSGRFSNCYVYTVGTRAFDVEYQDLYYRYSGEEIELSVKPEGNKNYTYQWFRVIDEEVTEDDDPMEALYEIPNGNSSKCLVGKDTISEDLIYHTGWRDTYLCRISDGTASVDAYINVMVYSTLQSKYVGNIFSDINNPKIITCELLRSAGDVSYQWQIGDKNGYTDIEGATGASFDTKDLAPGYYGLSCVVKDDYSVGRCNYSLAVTDFSGVQTITYNENLVEKFDLYSRQQPVLAKFVATSEKTSLSCDWGNTIVRFVDENLNVVDSYYDEYNECYKVTTKKGKLYYCYIVPNQDIEIDDEIVLINNISSENYFSVNYENFVAALMNEKVTLTVTPSDPEQTYTYRWVAEGNWPEYELVNEKSNTIELSVTDYYKDEWNGNRDKYITLVCYVSNGNLTQRAVFEVQFNTLRVKKASPDEVVAEVGKEINLSVAAESTFGNVKYRWRSFNPANSTEKLFEGENSASLNLIVENTKVPMQYLCEVSDGIETEIAVFVVYPQPSKTTDPVKPPVDLSTCNVSLSATSFVYDGTEKKPAVTVKSGDKTLVAGTDYKVAYSNNKVAGTAKVTVTGFGNYKGSVEKTFTIQKANLSNCTVSLSRTSYTYDGAEKKPVVTVKSGEKTLVAGTDYSVTYSNNRSAGTAKATVTGRGNYTGSVEKTFTIRFATPEITSVTNKAAGAKISWDAVNGATKYRVLRKATDGTWKKLADTTELSYTDGTVSSGKTYTYSVVCVNTDGTKELSKYDTTGKSILYLSAIKASVTNKSTGITVNWTKVTGAKGYYVYRKTGTGSYTKIRTITSGTTESYSDTAVKTNNGTKYTYYVRAYSGSTTGSYTSKVIYRLVGKTISSLTNTTGRKMLVKWTKDTKATGYQIQYSTSSTFASGNKTVSVTSNSTVSKTISSLTKGKKYYVRLRTYKTVSGTKYYSAWSSKKYVTISK